MSIGLEIAGRLRQGGLDALRGHLLTEAPSLPVARTRDYTLDPTRPVSNEPVLRPAAVLLPLVERDELSMLLTRRTDHLARHAGQIAFPGGRAQAGDASLAATALRETREETGIDDSFIRIAGFLAPYETGTGYAILPVVGLLRDGFALTPDPNEVADVFEVPLAFFLDPGNRRREERVFNGVARQFYSFTYGRHYIWGATAAMIVRFAEALNP